MFINTLENMLKATVLAKTMLSGLAIVFLAGCTSTTGMSNISPQYVSPNTYQNYDCTTLAGEYNRIQTYTEHAQKKSSGITTTGVGVGISAGRWGISPNINIGLGKSINNQAQNAKLSRLYGEQDAVVQTARIKKCAFAQGIKLYGE